MLELVTAQLHLLLTPDTTLRRNLNRGAVTRNDAEEANGATAESGATVESVTPASATAESRVNLVARYTGDESGWADVVQDLKR